MKPVTEGDHCTGTSLSGDFGYPGDLWVHRGFIKDHIKTEDLTTFLATSFSFILSIFPSTEAFRNITTGPAVRQNC